MPNFKIILIAACALSLTPALAQQTGSGKIVCWKDKSGKTVGCGDKVPPEYQDNASQELNKRGVVVKQSDAALTNDQKKALQAEQDKKAQDAAHATEQKRRDKALLDTFSSVNEIDLKRKRDIQLIESNIEAQTTNLKNANDRQADVRGRMDSYKKENKPVPPNLQEEFERAEAGKTKIQAQIAQKRKEIADLNQQYDDMKKRYVELTGTPAPAATTAATTTKPAATPAPAPAPAPAKK